MVPQRDSVKEYCFISVLPKLVLREYQRDLSLIISMPLTFSNSLTLSVRTAAFAFRA